MSSKRQEIETQLMKVLQGLLHETSCKEITITMRMKPVAKETGKEDLVVAQFLNKHNEQ